MIVRKLHGLKARLKVYIDRKEANNLKLKSHGDSRSITLDVNLADVYIPFA